MSLLDSFLRDVPEWDENPGSSDMCEPDGAAASRGGGPNPFCVPPSAHGPERALSTHDPRLGGEGSNVKGRDEIDSSPAHNNEPMEDSMHKEVFHTQAASWR